MIRIQQWQSECTGLNTSKIDRDEPKPCAAYRVQHLNAERIGYRPKQILGRQLDPRHLVMMAHPQIGESQLPQG
jgi:hypothetical protein